MHDAAFWDRIAPRYAKQPIADPDAYEETLARTASHLAGSARVVELGCGTGSTALRLAPRVAGYTGTDISAAMIGIAQDKAAEAGQQNLDFRQADMSRATWRGANFDAVLAFNLLHLVPDVAEALSVIHDLLPRGGHFVSKTPAVGEKWFYRPVIGVMRALGRAPRVTFLRVAEIDHAITAAGFRIVETGLYPPSTPSRFVVAEKR